MSHASHRKHLWLASILAPCFSHVVSSPAWADHLDIPAVEINAVAASPAVSTQYGSYADTAEVLAHHPSVDISQAGGISGLPSMRGLNDDRIKFSIDGADLTSACGNHMNPALSYISPASIESLSVLPGITPVSMGGDSIAGTVVLKSAAPNFANQADTLHTEVATTSAYKSNNNGISASLKAGVANENISLSAAGGVDKAQSYEDGKGHKVNATQYDRRYQNITLGLRGEQQLLTVRVGHQDVLYQGFPNQRMDMTDNQSDSLNVQYQHQFGWGELETTLFWQDVRHQMGFFSSEKPGVMPMTTKGQDYGYSIKADIPMQETQRLRLGHDVHRQTLNDYWPAVPMSMMMGPNTYVNINDGERTRIGVFAELESTWNKQWSSVLGIRDDFVRSDAGDVQSYDMTSMMQAADNNAARAFNRQGHKKDDNHIDFTALAKYKPSDTYNMEFGFAKKTRSPNLYERYSWGKGAMSSSMIGWFGDLNGYVGNLDLKPEKAHTLSASFHWHDADNQQWQFTLTPHYSYIQDYIGVQPRAIGSIGAGMMARPILQIENHDAQTYGLEATWKLGLWQDAQWGQAALRGDLSWLKGERVNNGDNLYHIMPLNTHIALEHNKAGWQNTLELELVNKKTQVDDVRLEPKTAGYGLVNAKTSYAWKHATLELSAVNLFDKYYELPMGGVTFQDWSLSGMGRRGPITALPGMGRSINIGLTLNY